VYLPEGTRVLAGEGQMAIAGETLIADLAGGETEPAFQRG
jgi:phosphatidylserine decarboxylase